MTHVLDSLLEAACRSCGCTTNQACWPTCTWAEPNLCSHCSNVPVHGIAPALQEHAIRMRTLRPHPSRARTRDSYAELTLRSSLLQLGQYRPVITRAGRDAEGHSYLEVLAGHGIVEQAATLGWNYVAAILHEDVNDETAARIVAIDNRSSDLGGYDQRMLQELLDLLPNLDATGYTVDDKAEIDALVALEDKRGLVDPDDVPPVQADPISEVGDVWVLGEHRLVVGDGTDQTVVAEALVGLDAALLVTDPPYNVAYEGKTAEALTIENDHLAPAMFLEFLLDLFSAAAANMRPGAPAYIFHADVEGNAFRAAFEEAGLDLKQVLVWVKDQFVLGRQDHQWQHEPILYGWKPGAAHDWHGGRTLTTVLDDERDPGAWSKEELVDLLRELRAHHSTVVRHDRPRRNEDHPTTKPVALIVELLERSSRPGALVLDMCAGSGSTLIACEMSGRRAGLVELDPRYADVIVHRWQAYTGGPALLYRGGVQVMAFDEAQLVTEQAGV